MKQITQSEFLQKAEKGELQEIFSIGNRVYALDHSYDFERARTGKLKEIIYMEVP